MILWSLHKVLNCCLPMTEPSSDTLNFLRVRINQFLRKRELICSGNLQLHFKHCSEIKNCTSAKLWTSPYSYLTQEGWLAITDFRCLLSRYIFCQHVTTNFWSISLVSKAMLYGVRSSLYNEEKKLNLYHKKFEGKKKVGKSTYLGPK